MATNAISELHCLHDLLYKKAEGPNYRLIVVGFKKLPGNAIAVIDEDDFEHFLAKDSQVQSYGCTIEDDEPYQPLIGELILAKMADTGRWYRCSFIEEVKFEDNEQQFFRVYATDWGFSQLVHSKDVRVSEIQLELNIQSHYLAHYTFLDQSPHFSTIQNTYMPLIFSIFFFFPQKIPREMLFMCITLHCLIDVFGEQLSEQQKHEMFEGLDDVFTVKHLAFDAGRNMHIIFL